MDPAEVIRVVNEGVKERPVLVDDEWERAGHVRAMTLAVADSAFGSEREHGKDHRADEDAVYDRPSCW